MIPAPGHVAPRPTPSRGGVPPGEGRSGQEDPLWKEGGTAHGLKVASSWEIQGTLYLKDLALPKAITLDV